MKNFRSKKGSAMVGALIIAILAGAIGAAAFNAALTEVKMSRRHMELQHAVTMAEAGLEEGVRAYLDGNWGGWTTVGSTGRYKAMVGTADRVYAGIGRTGEIRIFVDADVLDPVIVAEARINSAAAGSTITRQVKVEMEAGSLHDTGIVSKNSTTFKGGNVWIDSYDSRIGGYTDASWVNRFDNGTVASLSVLSDNLDVGNGNIRGFLATGSTTAPEVGPTGTVHAYNETDAANLPVDDTRITTDFYANLPDPSDPESIPTTSLGDITASGTIAAGDYYVDSINLAGNGETLRITGDAVLWVRGDVSITGNGSTISVDDGVDLEIYLEGSMKISGGGLVNGTGVPSAVQIIGLNESVGTEEISLGGNAELYAAVYAPNYDISISGGGADGNMFGSVVGYDVVLNGGARFHYDEALSDMREEDNMSISSWRELKDVNERLDFDNPSGLLSELTSLLSL